MTNEEKRFFQIFLHYIRIFLNKFKNILLYFLDFN